MSRVSVRGSFSPQLTQRAPETRDSQTCPVSLPSRTRKKESLLPRASLGFLGRGGISFKHAHLVPEKLLSAPIHPCLDKVGSAIHRGRSSSATELVSALVDMKDHKRFYFSRKPFWEKRDFTSRAQTFRSALNSATLRHKLGRLCATTNQLVLEPAVTTQRSPTVASRHKRKAAAPPCGTV